MSTLLLPLIPVWQKRQRRHARGTNWHTNDWFLPWPSVTSSIYDGGEVPPQDPGRDRAWETGRAASEDTFLAKKITRVIKPWRELSFAVSFSTVAHQRQETQWQKNPKLSGYRVTEDSKTDKAASPFSSSPSHSSFPSFPRTILSPYAAKDSQPSNTCVAFLLVPLVIDMNFTVSKWESSELKQPKDRLLPVVCLSVSLLHFSALIIMED